MTDFTKSHVFKKMTGFLVTVDILQKGVHGFQEMSAILESFLIKITIIKHEKYYV